MSQGKESGIEKTFSHPIFSTLYEWLFRGLAESYVMRPLRWDTAGKASGIVSPPRLRQMVRPDSPVVSVAGVRRPV